MVESDNKFKAKCRALQNHYRENVLNDKEMGYGPTRKSKNKYGNMLLNGAITGHNFISDAAFEYAKQKVRDKCINSLLTIDEYRLFNNMLSSMPMCFNLFSDLRKKLLTEPFQTSQIVKKLFSELGWIDTVQYIDIEFIPTPITDYTNDRSAFDAMIITTDDNGKKGLIAIETKYTDLLGSNISSDKDAKMKLIESEKIVDDCYKKYLFDKGFKQIDRNYLLTYTYAKKNGFKHFANVIISPKEALTKTEEKDFKFLKSSLIKNKDSIFKISIEEFVQRGQSCEQGWFAELMDKFYQSYLEGGY